MELSRKSTVVVILSFFMLLLLATVIHHQLSLIQMETYRSYPILFVGLLYFPAGVVLGLFQFLSQKNKQGKWAVQYLYLLGLGIPCLYLMNYTTLHFYLFSLPEFLAIPLLSANNSPLFGLLLGLIVSSSVYKR